jgi:hypothetical protein
VMVVRSDVAGSCGGLVSYGSSGMVDASGKVLRLGSRLESGLLVAGE